MTNYQETALTQAIGLLSRAHRESDITEAGLALPLLDQVNADISQLRAENERLVAQLTEANSGWSRAVRMVRMLATSAGTEAMPVAIDRVIVYLKEFDE